MWLWLRQLFRRKESKKCDGKVYLVTNYSEYQGTVFEPSYVPIDDSFLSKQWRRFTEYFSCVFRSGIKGSDNSDEAAADEANRLAFLRGSRSSNFIKTTKYSWLTFLPRVIFFQITRIGNMIFLGVSFLQLIDDVSDSNGIPTYLIPVVFVIVVCLLRELASDLARWRHDEKENGRLVHVFRGGKLVKMKQRDIRVGDIVKVYAYEYFPSDLVLLNCCDKHGVCNIETKNADGESNVKYKHVVPELAALFQNDEDAARTQIKIVCEPPSDDLSSFYGVAYYSNEDVHSIQTQRLERIQDLRSQYGGNLRSSVSSIDVNIKTVNLQFDQLLLRGTSMVNTEWAYCVAVYVGKETRLLKGSVGTSKRKSSKLEDIYQRNLFVVMMILVVSVFLSALLGVYWLLRVSTSHGYLHVRPQSSFMRTFFVTMGSMLLLLAAMIPVDLIILWEIVRMVESKQINWNTTMVSDGKRAVSRSDQLIEDLAHITHIYTDKTGTLTQNVMSLKALGFGNLGLLRHPKWEHYFWDFYSSTDPSLRSSLREFVLVASVCHSVVIRKGSETVIEKDEITLKSVNGKPRLLAVRYDPVEYDAASPDELALVVGMSKVGCVFTNRRTITEIDISLVTPEAQKLVLSEEEFALWDAIAADGTVPVLRFFIREALAFDSNRKCMSVVIEDTNGEILVLNKGADSAMVRMLHDEQQISWASMEEHLSKFATIGLRTLVCAVRHMDLAEYELWHMKYNEVLMSGGGRDTSINDVMSNLESNLKLVGCTGIEDLLQVEVGSVISDLKKAGIVIWVLTGDKLETAISIGHSTNMLNDDTLNAVLDNPDPAIVSRDLDGHLLNCLGATKLQNPELDLHVTSPAVLPKYSTECVVGSQSSEIAQEFTQFCVTITGDVLQTIYSCRVLKHRFFRLAQYATVVIACRMTHKQKCQLTRDNTSFNIHSTSLAIGDGANDVDMILTANVGVGIDGREGHQACQSADFIISEFRFLRQLLFVHGREALRKNTFLLYFCIFRNFSYSFVNVIYNFYTGFSGVSVFNTWSKQITNLFFTSIPLMFYVILDRQVPHELLTRYPILYNTWSLKPVNNFLRGLIRPFGSNWLVKRLRKRLEERRGVHDPLNFWGFILAALWLSIFETLIILKLTDTTDFSLLDGRPQTFGFNLFSQTMYVHHILAVNAIVCLVSKTWFWPNHFFIWGETLTLIIFWVIVSLVPAFAFVPEAHVFYGTFESLHTSIIYYGVILLTLVVSLFPFWGYLYYTAVFNPSLEDRIALQLKQGTFNGIVPSLHNSVAYVANEKINRSNLESGFAFAIEQRDALMVIIQRTIHKMFKT
ncbi:phospholipid-translocating P-type ATPase flippase family protein [Babesia bovis T2Bo]|uniref:Phospholipid-transporting ATPase n=1 Tax=Babesia bovis TaxID=5865 RepID=A7AP37_BABBO|nr:phospholipid-translocating P-type ATPase flippase family protein [Babesia bovis T2Bo]EDO08321.1 phospholipid-translocating P-type ATPase flippase family protein [Babesia bovis T2Bo]|eukprot:XP_001611889.1 phospholipid-translocating P-type ATPase, flippase family protein [Babesia bovis T2Bo]